MALEGTHIRFALDTRDDFEVKEINKYIAGSIYPDSRYSAGIDRTLTHNDSQMKKGFWVDDDFKKGWAAHLLYDKIQFSVHTDLFEDILKETNPEMTREEDWIVRTGLKILQDIEDVSQFDIKQHLEALKYFETPNGEDAAVVKKYNQLFVDIYSNAPNISIEDLEKMWSDWGVSKDITTKMRDKTYEIKNIDDLQSRVRDIYTETMKRKNDFYKKYCKRVQ